MNQKQTQFARRRRSVFALSNERSEKLLQQPASSEDNAFYRRSCRSASTDSLQCNPYLISFPSLLGLGSETVAKAVNSSRHSNVFSCSGSFLSAMKTRFRRLGPTLRHYGACASTTTSFVSRFRYCGTPGDSCETPCTRCLPSCGVPPISPRRVHTNDRAASAKIWTKYLYNRSC